MLLFLLSTLMASLSSLNACRRLSLIGRIELFAGALALFAGNIALVLLIAGIFGFFNPNGVFWIEAAVCFAVPFFFGKPRLSWRALFAGMLGGFSVRSAASSLKSRPFACFAIFFALAQLGWHLFMAFLFPPNGFDALSYHLVEISTWIQNGRFAINPSGFWDNLYPQNAELLFSWLALFFRDDTWIDAGQLAFAVVGVFASSAIARMAGLSPLSSLCAGCLFLFAPVLLFQTTENYVDVAFASVFLLFHFFLLRFCLSRPSLSLLVLAGISGGVLLGVKSSAAAYLAVSYAFALGAGFWRARLEKTGVLRLSAGFLLSFLLVAALGSYWYIRTWCLYGNPIYPFTVEFMGRTVFPGTGSVQDLIMASNTPASIRGLPLWRQLWSSWTAEPDFGSYSNHLGGFGFQWIFLQFPLLLAYIVRCWRFDKKFLAFSLAPLAAIFFIQPSQWYARYVIFAVAPGGIAFMWAMSAIRAKSLRFPLQAAMAACIALSSFSAMFHVYFGWAKIKESLSLPPQARTIGRLELEAFRFVDRVSDGSVIAYDSGTTYFSYALSGGRFQNRVFAVGGGGKDAFMRDVARGGADYFYTKAGEPSDMWAQSEPGVFSLFDESDGARAYKVEKKAAP